MKRGTTPSPTTAMIRRGWGHNESHRMYNMARINAGRILDTKQLTLGLQPISLLLLTLPLSASLMNYWLLTIITQEHLLSRWNISTTAAILK